MEDKKNTYFASFTERVGENIIEEMRKTTQEEEQNIRASYAESTIEYITSNDFVDLILRDSIFIMEFSIKLQEFRGSSDDLIVGRQIYTSIVIADLIMLENQLPYFIFDKLFGPYSMAFCAFETPDRLILELFSLHTKIKTTTKFNHFTDMFRCVYEESLDQSLQLNDSSMPAIREMKNADSLSRVGVEFKVN
ncbi:unnamed protein product [Microthlaspi erraticum]|uniref:Uncharacterized protein n=1 Tax=Microthlaspi erraticum TaxID=1685480 RepID=A0A6D2I9V0_9BRAS|nr:unnamed protein product [Microthlaspi erraticum]